LSVLVDTSVWSLALRRDRLLSNPFVDELGRLIAAGDTVITTGVVLQELLQGVSGPTAPERTIQRFSALPLLVPDRRDHIDAAALRNHCRRNGVQVVTIDALLAQLCIRHDLVLLSADKDFGGSRGFRI
jgi:predicted nucleic acid-binding protein